MARSLAIAALVLLAPATGLAQQRPVSPRLGYACPAGMQVGTTATITLGGQALVGATSVRISGSGVRATIGEYKRPMTQQQVQQLRDKIEEAQTKLGIRINPGRPAAAGANGAALLRLMREAGITAEELKALNDFRISRTDPKRMANPLLDETLALEVTVDADAAPGVRELRLVTGLGITNPVRLVVGRYGEFREQEPNEKTPDVVTSALPVVLNGQITPGDVDRFQFDARKGQRMVVQVAARSITPYLADAVPGWFQAVVRLTNASGTEVGYSGNYRFAPDPVLLCSIPADGRYTLEVRDSIYRGRQDFVYRVTVGEVPFVTGAFPLGGSSATNVSLLGWNLPATHAKIEVGGLEPGTHDLPLFGDPTLRLPFQVGTGHEVTGTPTKGGQPISPGTVVNGRIGQPGEVDQFLVSAKAGTRLVAEVTARRLGSPLDSCLQVTDPRGCRLAFNDDWDDRSEGLLTHQADSRVEFTMPAGGKVALALRDTQSHGGPEYGYRLAVREPQPDFSLRMVPSSVVMRPGTVTPITVYALRKDGFTGAIDLDLGGTLPRFRVSGGRIPPGQDRVQVTITSPALAMPRSVELLLQGRATIGKQVVSHRATPCDDMMQAFFYRHLVPCAEMAVAVAFRPLAGPSLIPLDADPIQVPEGGTAVLQVQAPAWLLKEKLQFGLPEGPDGLVVEGVRVVDTHLEITVKATGDKARAGLAGNLVLLASREVTGAGLPGATTRPAAAVRRQQTLGYVPAIPFEVVKPTR